MLTNHELLNVIAKERKHTFISTGMSTIEQIKEAVNIFRKNNCTFELQHSNSSYPMKMEEANLKCIQTLKKEFNCDGNALCIGAGYIKLSSDGEEKCNLPIFLKELEKAMNNS